MVSFILNWNRVFAKMQKIKLKWKMRYENEISIWNVEMEMAGSKCVCESWILK